MARDQDMQPLDIGREQVAEHVDPAVRFEIAGVVICVLVDHLFGEHGFELDHRQIAEPVEIAGLVQHIGDAARHAGGEIAPGLAEHHTMPPVMYSQQWSPAPSTTATAPELRTAKRSPAM